MAEAASQQRPGVPAGAVAATGGDALERVERLLNPPTPLPPPARLAASMVLLAVAAAPLLVLALASVVPVLAACPSLG